MELPPRPLLQKKADSLLPMVMVTTGLVEHLALSFEIKAGVAELNEKLLA